MQVINLQQLHHFHLILQHHFLEITQKIMEFNHFKVLHLFHYSVPLSHYFPLMVLHLGHLAHLDYFNQPRHHSHQLLQHHLC